MSGLGNPQTSVLSGGTLTGPLDLGGQPLYGNGIDQTTGVIRYFPATHALQVAIKDGTPARQLIIGIADSVNGVDGDYTHTSGFQILGFGDIGGVGNSASMWNLNTVEASANDTTMMLGGGATLKRGFAFQMYNNGRFGGETFDMAASANEQGLLHLSSGVNQTGTASYALIRGEVHETTTGSGFKRLLDLGTNSGVPSQMVSTSVTSGVDAGGYTTKFWVDSSGNTFANGAIYSTTGLQYSTADSTGVKAYGGGLVTLTNTSGGVGAFVSDQDTASLTLAGKLTTANRPNLLLSNYASGAGFSAASGLQQHVGLNPTIAQTGSASYTALEIAVTESSTGSGNKYLLNALVGGASKAYIDNTGLHYYAGGALTAGTMTATTPAVLPKVVHRFDWTNAMVVALGGGTTGDIAIATLPAKTIVTNAYVVIKTAAGTLATLTVAVGRVSAGYIDYIVASDAKAGANTVYGDASGERGTNLTGYDLPSYTGTTVVNAHFIGSAALNTVTTSTGTVFLETMLLP